MALDSTDLVKDFTLRTASATLGTSVREARRHRGLTLARLADDASLDVATVKAVQRGKGQVGSLTAIFDVLQHQFAAQPPGLEVGRWLATLRRGSSTAEELGRHVGLSKPTVLGLEANRGRVANLLRILEHHRVVPNLAPFEKCTVTAHLHLGDCLEVMAGLPASSVDAILADVPYGITMLAWDKPIDLEAFWAQARRLLRPRGTVVMFAAQPFTSELVQSNRPWFKYSLVWRKNRATGFVLAKHRPLKDHEDIVVFSPGVIVTENRSSRQMTYNPQGLVELNKVINRREGVRKINHLGIALENRTVQTHTNYPRSVLEYPLDWRPEHPTAKPVALMRHLVATYSNPGDTILDPTAGSGSTGVAAIELGRRFTGIEMHAPYLEIARRRIIEADVKARSGHSIA